MTTQITVESIINAPAAQVWEYYTDPAPARQK